MKIGLLSYNLSSGGAERVLCKWSDILIHNHQIVMIVFDNAIKPTYPYSGTLRTLYVPSNGTGIVKRFIVLYKRIRYLKKEIKKHKYEALISFCSTANFPTMFQNIPRIASIRVYSEYFSYLKEYRFLIKHTKTHLVVQTYKLRDDILKDVGLRYENKIHVIPNPLDVALVTKKAEEEVENEYLDRIKGKKVILCVASFKKTKNHWNLLKSFQLLHNEMSQTILVLVGGDGELEDNIREMANRSNAVKDIVFVGKTTNPFKYAKYADVFVLPSLTEGIPNVILEALAMGLPIVSTDCLTGPREILCRNPDIHKTTKGIEIVDFGILVSPFSSDINYDYNSINQQNINLKEAIQRTLTDIKLAERLRTNALIRAQEYDLEQYSIKLNELINLVFNKCR